MKLLQAQKQIKQRPQNPTNLEFHAKKSEQQQEEEPSNSSSQSHKKTRDLPNLNKCHACGFIVDVCAGKKRLHILNSHWRIVLLCKNCLLSIKSSKMCSYCLLKSASDCYRCEKCKHCVHKKCFLKNRHVPPWSYACNNGFEFSVCVDCWLPKSVPVSRQRLNFGKVLGKGRVELENGSSSFSLEDVGKDANVLVGKKGEAAVIARGAQVIKAVYARRGVKAVKVPCGALSLVVNGEENSLNKRLKVSDDRFVELCPAVSVSRSSSGLFDSSDLDVMKGVTCSSDSPCVRSNMSNSGDSLKHEILSGGNVYRDSLNCESEPSYGMDGSDKGTSSKVGKRVPLIKHVYARRADKVASGALNLAANGDGDSLNKRRKVSVDEVAKLCPTASNSLSRSGLINSSDLNAAKVVTCSSDSPCVSLNPSNSSDSLKHEISSDGNVYKDSHKCELEPSFCMDGSDKGTSLNVDKCMVDCDAKVYMGKELMKEREVSCSDKKFIFKGYSRLKLKRKQVKTEFPGEERCNGDPDRYSLKYRRRVYRSNPILHCELKILYNNNETKLESQGSATEVRLNCSGESTM